MERADSALELTRHGERVVSSGDILENLHVPPWAQEPELWQRAIDLVLGGPAPFVPTFIHRDYQHFNLLWVRGKLSGIVDWIYASTGPMDVDTGHCRLNLAVLYSADWAERFRMAYEAEAGRKIDPWYDIASLVEYLPGWGPGLDLQIGNRVKVDRKGMHGRVEELLKQALGRV